MEIKKVAILTAGGIAPCLSAAVSRLIQNYSRILPNTEIICYVDGYKGLLLGDSIVVSDVVRKNAHILADFGGSPIGNSRVKLTNVEDCVKRGLTKNGQIPLNVAAEQLKKDNVQILHTIGGDDTNTTAADLAEYLKKNGYKLNVIGMPKTIDNDVYPIKQSLGAYTAASEGAKFFANVVAEGTANPRMLIIHEVMGRHCGWLTAETAIRYRKLLNERTFLTEIGLSKKKFDIHAVYIPEMQINIEKEAARLKKVMDSVGCVNIFVSEGACVDEIVAEIEKSGATVKRDAFGHVKLDSVNPGQWFATQFAEKLCAEKVLVQKSGYFARSAAANTEDIDLIFASADFAIQCAIDGLSGVVGLDEDNKDKMSCIEFSRIKGGKPFDYNSNQAFMSTMTEINQI